MFYRECRLTTIREFRGITREQTHFGRRLEGLRGASFRRICFKPEIDNFKNNACYTATGKFGFLFKKKKSKRFRRPGIVVETSKKRVCLTQTPVGNVGDNSISSRTNPIVRIYFLFERPESRAVSPSGRPRQLTSLTISSSARIADRLTACIGRFLRTFRSQLYSSSTS